MSRRRVLQFPPRPLRPDERKLVAEWLAAAGDVALAYVSDRRSDDPEIYRRIVITVEGNGAPTHLVHTPFGVNFWMVMRVRSAPEIQRFDSLHDALNSIRPVLPKHFGRHVGPPGSRDLRRA